MLMRLLFSLSVKQTLLPLGYDFGEYRVQMTRADGVTASAHAIDKRWSYGPLYRPGDITGHSYSARSPSNAVPFDAVEEGTYAVSINAYDTKGRPLMETPVTGTYVVAAPVTTPPNVPVYYDAPTGFSVSALPAVGIGPVPPVGGL